MALTDDDLDLNTALISERADTLTGVSEPDDDDGLTAEALVGGAPLQGPRPCEHGGAFSVQTVVGTMKDEDAKVLGWQVRVRVRCGSCGIPMHPLRWTARAPQDNPIGVVLDLAPVDGTDDELAAAAVDLVANGED